MSLSEISVAKNGNLLTTNLEQENLYKKECLRIFTEIEDLNKQSGGRIAIELHLKEEKFLLLTGLGKISTNRDSHKYNIFLLSKDRIYSRDCEVGKTYQPSLYVLVDAFYNKEELARIEFTRRFFTYDSVVIPVYSESDKSCESLQDAINNSLRLAVPKPPIDPIELSKIAIKS